MRACRGKVARRGAKVPGVRFSGVSSSEGGNRELWCEEMSSERRVLVRDSSGPLYGHGRERAREAEGSGICYHSGEGKQPEETFPGRWQGSWERGEANQAEKARGTNRFRHIGPILC